jgi:CBS domain containing-hemolysin-like protein
MTPRTELEAVPITITLDALLAVVLNGTHNRLVVYQGSLDDVQGVLHVRDLLKVVAQPAAAFDLRALLRPVLTVPASKPADALLEEMQAARRQLAVVLDEYGGTAGIVTIEDLVEALVGRIEDEPAPGAAGPLLGADQRPDDGSVVLDGLMRLDELEELTGLRVEPEDHELVETVGGLVMARLGRIPDVGDEVLVGGRALRVERRDGRRVAAVRLGAATPAREAAAEMAGSPESAAPAPPRT